MSIIEDIGAQVRTGSDELPVAAVTAGLARLRAGLDQLRWARQESDHELGVDRLAVAAEHLENAGRALLVAQEQLGGYLTAIGLTRDGSPAPLPPASGGAAGGGGPGRSGGGTGAEPLANWWRARVAVLTDTEESDRDGGTADPDDLLLRVADRVRAGDRSGLAAELGSVKAHVGLALAALAPARAYDAATHLLGRPPKAEDLSRLSSTARSRIGSLLPGLPDEAISTQLARLCRAPVEPSGTPLHPADSAVAGAVLAGVLLGEAGLNGRESEPTPRDGRESRDRS